MRCQVCKCSGIAVSEPHRFPLIAQQRDFEAFDLVVALKEAEHRPMMAQRFPGWADRIEYWSIHDIDAAEPEEALRELERRCGS